MKKRYTGLMGIMDSKVVTDDKVRCSKRHITPLLRNVGGKLSAANATGSRFGKSIESIVKIDIPLTKDISIKSDDSNSDKEWHKSTINRIEMEPATNDVRAVASERVEHSTLTTGEDYISQDDVTEYHGKVDLKKEVANMVEENLTRRPYYRISESRTGKCYNVPANLITIGGASGLGKTGIDMKMSIINGLIALVDVLQWVKMVEDENVSVQDTPEYIIHRLSRVQAVYRYITDQKLTADEGSKDEGIDSIRDINMNNSSILALLSMQSSYLHVEEPCRDALDIVIPKTKGLKVLSNNMRSDMAGSTVDSLTSQFFSVSGGAMSGGWNPSEAKSLLASIDKFANRYNHPVIAVINYLKFNREGQRGIMSVCQSMASMHIDLNLNEIAIRTLTGDRVTICDDVVVVGIGVHTVKRDTTDAQLDDKANDGSVYISLESNEPIDEVLTRELGIDIILPEQINDMLNNRSNDVDVNNPLALVVNQNHTGKRVVFENEISIHDADGNKSSIADEYNSEVSRVIKSTKMGDSRKTVFNILSGKLRANDGAKNSRPDSNGYTVNNVDADHRDIQDLRSMSITALKSMLKNTYLKLSDINTSEYSASHTSEHIANITTVLLEKGVPIEEINDVIDN